MKLKVVGVNVLKKVVRILVVGLFIVEERCFCIVLGLSNKLKEDNKRLLFDIYRMLLIYGM